MAQSSVFLRQRSLAPILAGLLLAAGLMGCSDGCLSTSDDCSGLDDDDDLDVNPGSGSSGSNDDEDDDTNMTDGSSTDDSDDDTSSGDGEDITTDMDIDDDTMSSGDEDSDDATGDDGASQDDTELSCDADSDELSSCDVCVRGSCCAQLLDCSNSIDCSGGDSDDNIATGEFGCVQDFIAEAEVNDGFVDLITLEDAKEACRASDAISPETEALLGCMLVEASPVDGESCATTCLGIIQ